VSSPICYNVAAVTVDDTPQTPVSPGRPGGFSYPASGQGSVHLFQTTQVVVVAAFPDAKDLGDCGVGALPPLSFDVLARASITLITAPEVHRREFVS